MKDLVLVDAKESLWDGHEVDVFSLVSSFSDALIVEDFFCEVWCFLKISEVFVDFYSGQ